MLMNRKQAITAVWDLINNNDYSGADKLYNAQTRIHGRRVFGCRIKMIIKNGLWCEKNNLT